MKLFHLSLVLGFLELACSRTPEPSDQAKGTPAPAETVVQAAGASEEASAADIPLLTPTPSPVPQYSNPTTEAAVVAYTAEWQQLKKDTESAENLGEVDPVSDPSSIVDYANRIGADATALDQAEKAARETMTLSEKKRFRAYQEELNQTGQ